MSESFLTRLLSLEKDEGLEALTFVLLHEIGHIAKKHNLRNLTDTYKWGDLRKQYFMFENQYIGFDALFMDYYTNARFTLDQELEADLFALRIMQDLGIPIR